MSNGQRHKSTQHLDCVLAIPRHQPGSTTESFDQERPLRTVDALSDSIRRIRRGYKSTSFSRCENCPSHDAFQYLFREPVALGGAYHLAGPPLTTHTADDHSHSDMRLVTSTTQVLAQVRTGLRPDFPQQVRDSRIANSDNVLSALPHLRTAAPHAALCSVTVTSLTHLA